MRYDYVSLLKGLRYLRPCITFKRPPSKSHSPVNASLEKLPASNQLSLDQLMFHFSLSFLLLSLSRKQMMFHYSFPHILFFSLLSLSLDLPMFRHYFLPFPHFSNLVMHHHSCFDTLPLFNPHHFWTADWVLRLHNYFILLLFSFISFLSGEQRQYNLLLPTSTRQSHRRLAYLTTTLCLIGPLMTD